MLIHCLFNIDTVNQKTKLNRKAWVSHFTVGQFARIFTSSLINIEKIFDRSIIKFYNGDDAEVIAAQLRLTKTKPSSLHKKHNLL